MRVALESAGTRLAASPLAGIATAGRRRCSATGREERVGLGERAAARGPLRLHSAASHTAGRRQACRYPSPLEIGVA